MPFICLMRCAYQAYKLDTCPLFVCCAALIRPTNSIRAPNLSAALRLSGLRTRHVPAICLLRCAYQAYELDTCPLFVCCAALIRPTNSIRAPNLSAALRLSGLRTRHVPAICLLRCAYQAYELDTCPLFVCCATLIRPTALADTFVGRIRRLCRHPANRHKKTPPKQGFVILKYTISDAREQSGICVSDIRPGRSRCVPDARMGTTGTASYPAPGAYGK